MKNLITTAFLLLSAFTSISAFDLTAEGSVKLNGNISNSELVIVTIHQELPSEQIIIDSVFTDVNGQYFSIIELSDNTSRGTQTISWTDCVGRVQSVTYTYSVIDEKNNIKYFSCDDNIFVDVNIFTRFIFEHAPNQAYAIEIIAPEYTFSDTFVTNSSGFGTQRLFVPSSDSGIAKITWLYNCGGENMTQESSYAASPYINANFRCVPENSRNVFYEGTYKENNELVGFERYRVQLYDTMGYKHQDFIGRTYNDGDYKGVYNMSIGIYQEFVGVLKYTWYSPCDGSTRITTEEVDFSQYEGYFVHYRDFVCNDFTLSNTTVPVTVSGYVQADEVLLPNYELVIRATDDNETTYFTDTITSDSIGNYTHQFDIHDNFIGTIHADWYDPCISESNTVGFYTSDIQVDTNINIYVDCETGNPDLTTSATVGGYIRVNGVGITGQEIKIWVKNMDDEVVYVTSPLFLGAGTYSHEVQLPKYFEGTIHTEWVNECTGIKEMQMNYVNNLAYGVNQFTHNYDCAYGSTTTIFGQVHGYDSGVVEDVTDAEVILYQKDETTGVFNAADTFNLVPDSDYPGRYEFEADQDRNYLVKVIPLASSISIPTYYESAATWQEAQVIKTGGIFSTSYNITMILASQNQGTSMVGGSFTNNGELDVTINAVLTDKNTNRSFVQKIDSNGRYDFHDVPTGEYTLTIDATGISAQTMDVSVNAFNDANTNLNFEYSGSVKKGVIKIADTTTENINFTIYPNPSSNHVTVTISETIIGDLLIKDTSGRILKTMLLDGSKTVRIDVSDFANGVYFMTVNAYDNTYSEKFIKH
jgi:hypothetical protein